MKIKVNTMNTGSILMSEAVNMPIVMMMTFIVSDESLVKDRYTDRQTHKHTKVVYVNLVQSKTLKTKSDMRKSQNYLYALLLLILFKSTPYVSVPTPNRP